MSEQDNEFDVEDTEAHIVLGDNPVEDEDVEAHVQPPARHRPGQQPALRPTSRVGRLVGNVGGHR